MLVSVSISVGVGSCQLSDYIVGQAMLSMQEAMGLAHRKGLPSKMNK